MAATLPSANFAILACELQILYKQNTKGEDLVLSHGVPHNLPVPG